MKLEDDLRGCGNASESIDQCASHHQEQRRLPAGLERDVAKHLESAGLQRLRSQLFRHLAARARIQQLKKPRERALGLQAEGANAGADFLRDRRGVVGFAEAEDQPQQAAHGKVRDRAALREAVGLQAEHGRAEEALAELGDEPRFADARLANYTDDPPAPLARHLEQAAQQLQLVMPADQRSRSASDGQTHALAAGQA
jgi:hypothetical protein